MDPKSQPAGMRSDKLMNRGKDAVFVGYLPDTTKMWLFWEPDMKAIRPHNTAVWFENEKGGDIELNVPKLNQPSTTLIRKPVGRPPKKQQGSPTDVPIAKPLFVQLPPPPQDRSEYQEVEDLRGGKENLEPTSLEEEQTNQDTQEPQPQQEEAQDQEGTQKRKRSMSDEGLRPEKIHSMVTRPTVQKRLREPEDDLPEAKHYKAFFTMMTQLDPSMVWVEEFLEEVEEAAFVAVALSIA